MPQCENISIKYIEHLLAVARYHGVMAGVERPAGGAVVPGVRKIAVLRANALGDLMFAMPGLYSLRAAYPDAEIVLLGRRWHRDFLQGRPGPVDRVEVVPPSPGVSAEEGDEADGPALEAFFARMQAERFDIALQMHGGGRNSNPFVRRLGARLTAGTATSDAVPLDRTMPYIYFQSEIMRYLETVALVGAAPVMLETRIELTERDRAEAASLLPPGGPIAVIHPGVSSADRLWPVERFAGVGDALARSGARVVVTGSEVERALVRRMVSLMAEPAVPLAGVASLGGLAALIAQARLLVSNDTGPLHLAEAVGTPTVGIYWCFNLINGGTAFRTNNRPLVSWVIECPLCGRSQVHDPCDHKVSYVEDVTVAEVTEQALDLWGDSAAARTAS